MTNLIKADLKRMFHDKLFMIACIIGAGFALMTSILYMALNNLVESVSEMQSVFSAKTTLAESFAPLSNFGLALPIFICIIINKDFSYGTIRNKIICGYSRTKIYLSILISTATLVLSCILGYTIISFGLSSVLLEYSTTTTFIQDIGYILLTILFGTLGYTLFACLITFFCVSMKNLGIAIVLYFGISFLFTVIATALSISNMFIPDKESMDGVKTLIDILCHINIFYLFSSVIGYTDVYTVKEILYIIFDVVIFGSLTTLLGIYMFNKKNLK